MTRRIKIHQCLIVAVSLLIAAEGSSSYETFSQSYNLLSTIAGNGAADNDDQNLWRAEYEGKPAVSVQLSSPHMAMADSAGNIYIADKDAQAIRKVNREGILTTVAGTNVSGDGGEGRAVEQALSSPNGVWVNKKGEFYILDMVNGKIRKVDLDGNMTTLFKDPAGISLGRGLWVSNAEDTVWYASGTQVRMWTNASGIVTWASGFSGLANIVQDRNGYIVATDRVGNAVYRIVKQDSKTIIAGTGATSGGGDGSPALETAFWGVRGVWFLEDNTYFLATHEGSKVWYIDNGGIAHLFLNGIDDDDAHSGDGQNYRTPGIKISEARSVTVDYQGNVLVAENDRGFIRRIEKNSAAVLLKRTPPGNGSLRVCSDPSSGSIRCMFTLLNPQNVTVRLFDQSGRLAEVLMTGRTGAGRHEIRRQNRDLPCGVYFVGMQSETISLTRQFVLLH